MPSPLTGQIAVTPAAAPLTAAAVPAAAFTIKASVANSNPVFIGDKTVSTTTGFRLDPGDSMDYEKNDQQGSPRLQLSVSDFFVVGSNGDSLSWLASP